MSYDMRKWIYIAHEGNKIQFKLLLRSLIKIIRKTYLYNFDPLKLHFYIVKLGLQGYTLFFLFLLKKKKKKKKRKKKKERGGSNEYPQSMFWAEMWKISELFIWKFSVFGGEIFNIFE